MKLGGMLQSGSRPRGRSTIGWVLTIVLLCGILATWLWNRHASHSIVRIGILHALTGPMAISEKPMVEAEQLAIEEINAAGGVLGHRIEAVIADTQSKTDLAASKLERLITEDKVVAVIGCWTSACRKTVKPIIERHGNLLIYPMAYEGLEKSPNIIYTGAAPNQQVLPAVNWSYVNLGKRFFLIGSDYIWPHTVNAIVADQLMALGGEVVGETYLPFGSTDPSAAIAKIREAKPDVILSTIVGDSNAPFYRALKTAGLTPQQSPVVSFAISETEVEQIPNTDISGHYSAWNYFQSIDRPENTEFVQAFRKRYGANRVLSDVMETAYLSAKLWARAAERANSVAAEDVNQSLMGLSYDAPEGIVTIDPATRHTWRSFHVGKISEDGRITSVWSAGYPIRPIPYPRSRSVSDWDRLVQDLYVSWNHNWVNTTVTLKPGQP